MTEHLLWILVETAPKRVFVSALDWPGLARGARQEAGAIEMLLAAPPRYARIAEAAGLAFPVEGVRLEVEERIDGDAGTEFGVPSVVAAADRTPVTAPEGARLAALVEAAWAAFDRIAGDAPAELRKGPRGGGRDTSQIVAHVNDADAAYAGVLGIPPAGRRPIERCRAAVLARLREPSDGSPIAGKKWPPRYAARRIAWHALDHAWEIEDRSELA
jgi:hypothetical protein